MSAFSESTAIRTIRTKHVTSGCDVARENIRKLLERWARWRAYRAGSDLGFPKADSIGRAMSSMPSTKCTTCDGKGKVSGGKIGAAVQSIICPTCGGKGKVTLTARDIIIRIKNCPDCNTGKPTDRPGEVNGKTCIRCRGAGKIRTIRAKANPAFIPSTRPRSEYGDDPLSQKIDFLICTKLTEDQRTILVWEYTRNGTQAEKSEKLKITWDSYRKRVERAVTALEVVLDG